MTNGNEGYSCCMDYSFPVHLETSLWTWCLSLKENACVSIIAEHHLHANTADVALQLVPTFGCSCCGYATPRKHYHATKIVYIKVFFFTRFS